jgi:hypothetical protein
MSAFDGLSMTPQNIFQQTVKSVSVTHPPRRLSKPECRAGCPSCYDSCNARTGAPLSSIPGQAVKLVISVKPF